MYVCRKSYIKDRAGKAKYMATFQTTEWVKLSHQVKKQHRTVNCLKCVDIPNFGLKKANRFYIDSVKNQKRCDNDMAAQIEAHSAVRSPTHSCSPSTLTQHDSADTPDVTQLRFTSTPRQTGNRAQNKDATPITRPIKRHGKLQVQDIPKKIRQCIIDEAQKKQLTESLEADKNAVFGDTTSLRSHDQRRGRQGGILINHPVRAHTGNHVANYSYKKDVILAELTSKADSDKDLKNSMTGKWSALARKAELKSLQGAHTLPATQVPKGLMSSQCIHIPMI